MRNFLALLFVFTIFQSALFAQNKQAVFRMELEAVPGGDEVIANLIAVEFDSVVGFHFGLVWDTAFFSYVGVEDYGPLYQISGSHPDRIIYDAASEFGILQSIWIEEGLNCTGLEPETTVFSFRLNAKQPGGVIQMETNLLQIPGVPFTSVFEMVHCEGFIMDVIYVSNLQDTMIIIDGVSVSTEEPQQQVDIQILPNPSTGLVTMMGKDGTSGHWQLVDRSGRLIQEGVYQSLPQSLDFSTVEQGIYFLRFKDNQGHKANLQKLVISR